VSGLVGGVTFSGLMPSLDAILRANPEFVDAMYHRWREDPDSVDPTWGLFFAGYELGDDGGNGRPAAPTGTETPVVLTATGALPEGIDESTVEPALRIYDVLHTYRAHGHLIAQIDPLGRNPTRHPFLELSEFGFTAQDLDQEVVCSLYKGMQHGTLREFLAHLADTYCGSVGVEYMDIPEKAEREWLQGRMEPVRNHPAFPPERRLEILGHLAAADTFEEALHKRYPGAKRFSLEGATTLVPLLMTVVERGAAGGVEDLVMGMAHRGRLNILAHVLGKPYAQILAEFEGRPMPSEVQGYGDVKYHLGYSRDHESPGATIHLTLAYNPSHLEAIDPIVVGNVRARQNFMDDGDRVRAVPLLMHGDAAFAAQGVVAETLMLSELDAYTTGGTIHVIINNQIGFTTDPEDARSTRYASDIAKIVHAPIFHVNGDDAEAVVHVAELALDYRQAFHRDVVIDLVCYRRYGHNELDDPTFTQPRMYALVAEHPSNSTVYAERLIEEGVETKERVEAMRTAVVEALDAARGEAREMAEQPVLPTLGRAWEGLSRAGDEWSAETAVPRETLERVARALITVPEGFHWHQRLKRLMEERAATVLEDGPVDWGCGEALAFGSLLLEGTKVRLSGQDTVRGTFSHRHAIYYDAETGEPYVPLNHLSVDQNTFHVVNSPLSENAALGFEYGYSTADPWTLVIWEAQFGDFVNGAQVVIDQFIATGEYKWGRMTGLVLLLPHGYEGQGPEHSSARLERFLELCSERNMQVCNLTTPAQLFHAFRRQLKRDFRKPLIIMSPKSLLRHRLAVSRVEELTNGSFKPILDDGDDLDRAAVRTLLACSGKVYYTLLEARRERGITSHAIARIEQLYPFPDREMAGVLSEYPNLERLVWVQEEPVNMGAWRNSRHRLERNVPEGVSLSYVARPPSASPATGAFGFHQKEEQSLIDAALAEG
jgi:2-oxoglutarate dehydrogenase E1 component